MNNQTESEEPSLSSWVLEPIATGGTAMIHKRSGRRYEYTHASSLVCGVAHPPFIRQEVWEAQRSQLAFRSTDVFVSTFAKCGTTLTEQIVLLLLNGGRSEGLDPLNKNAFDPASGRAGKIWTETAVLDGLDGLDASAMGFPAGISGEGRSRMSKADFDALPPPRVLKTHEPIHLFLDQGRTARVLYVARNPFDACVSCYYHPAPGISPHSRGVPFDAFCKLWLSERVEFGGWISHVKGWRREHQRGDGAMLWMSYEEITTNPVESIEKIAAFIGVDTDADPALVTRVAEGCRFDNVKKAAQDSMGEAKLYLGHLRKGKIGDWRNHFSKELFEELEKEIHSHFDDNMDLEFDIGEGQLWKPGAASPA